MYSEMASLKYFTLFLLLCFNIENHYAVENNCVVVVRKRTFERCKLLNSTIALCNEDLVRVRNCLPKGRTKSWRCLAKEDDTVKFEELSGTPSISHPGLSEIKLETTNINKEPYKNAAKRLKKRSVRVAGSSSFSSKTSSSSSTVSQTASKSSSFDWSETASSLEKMGSILSSINSISNHETNSYKSNDRRNNYDYGDDDTVYAVCFLIFSLILFVVLVIWGCSNDVPMKDVCLITCEVLSTVKPTRNYNNLR